jgi:hypothetical protein
MILAMVSRSYEGINSAHKKSPRLSAGASKFQQSALGIIVYTNLIP